MGLLASLLSAALSASKDLVSKRLAVRLDGTASTFASFAFALPYYIAVLSVLYLLGWETFTWSRSFFVLVVLRAVTDSLAEGMKMYAFAHGDISVVATFFSLSPIFLLVASPLITGDKVTVLGAAAVLLTVGGSLILVYRPSQAGWASQQKGIMLATGASVFFALNSCFDRLAVQQGTPVFAGFTMTLLSALCILPFVLGRRRTAMWDQQWPLWVRGFLEVAFMVCKLVALQHLSAPYVVGVQRLSLLLSIVGGWVFFGERDFARRLVAGALIVGGTLLIAWLEW